MEFQENPFARRMLDIFIATDSGKMTFIEFLDMVSTFSPKVKHNSVGTGYFLKLVISLVEGSLSYCLPRPACGEFPLHHPHLLTWNKASMSEIP